MGSVDVLREVIYYQVICSGCGKSAHTDSEYSAWGSPEDARTEADAWDWVCDVSAGTPTSLTSGLDFCPDCTRQGEDGLCYGRCGPLDEKAPGKWECPSCGTTYEASSESA